MTKQGWLGDFRGFITLMVKLKISFSLKMKKRVLIPEGQLDQLDRRGGGCSVVSANSSLLYLFRTD